MKTYYSLFALCIVVCSCGQKSYRVEDYISDAQRREEILFQIVRHTGKLPDNKTHEQRFLPEMDSAHRAHQIERNYRFEAYCVKKDTHYYMVSRIAPSLYEKRICLAGKIVFDQKGDIVEFEEVFRTFKMLDEERKRKSEMLYQLMLEGKDLSPYYFKNSKGEEFIEFPDEYNYYDKKQRRWITLPRY